MNNTPRARLEAAAREARSSLPALGATAWHEQTRPAASAVTERATESARPALAGTRADALVYAMVRGFNGRSQ